MVERWRLREKSGRDGGRRTRERQLFLFSACLFSCCIGALAGREQELKAMLDRLEQKYKLQEFGTSKEDGLDASLGPDQHTHVRRASSRSTSSLYGTNFIDDLLNGNQDSSWTAGPSSYDSGSLADSMQDLNADIERRENLWDSLVDQGGEEYANLKVHNIRNEASRKIGEAQAVAQGALRREYANSVAAVVQQAMMRSEEEKREDLAAERAKTHEKEAADAEKKALILQIVNAAILQKQKKLKLEYSTLKKESERKIQELHRKLRRLKKSQEEAGLTAARLREREKLAKSASEASRSQAEKVEGKMETLLDRLGDARAGLAWLSAKLGAARDDASSAHSAEERWERKAEDAGKRARSAEEDKENALSQMRQERRRAKRHLKLEEEANAKEEEERREEVDAIAARRKAEVWAAREEAEADAAKSEVSRMASAAEKEREAMKKAKALLRMEQKKEEEAEEAESQAESKSAVLESEDENLQQLAQQLEIIIGHREAEVNASKAAAARAREEEEEAKQLAQQAQEEEKAAEEKEMLTIQRMHQLEASGVEDSREMMRLRAELAKAHNETEAARLEGAQTRSAWKFSEQERIKAEAAENDAILSANDAQKERQEALAKIQAEEEKTKSAIEEKDAASKAAADAAKEEAEEEELAKSEKTQIEEEEENLKNAYARAGELEEKLKASQAARQAAEDATKQAQEGEKKAEQENLSEAAAERFAKELAGQQQAIAANATMRLEAAMAERAKAEEQAAEEVKKAASASKKAEEEEQEAKTAGEEAAKAKALMAKEEEEAKTAHEAADAANGREEEAEKKLAAALARAEKEQEEAQKEEEEDRKKLKDANDQFVQASQAAARAQERADELEEQLKAAQRMADAAQARAEMYSASAASNATALEEERKQAEAWKVELERRAAAAEEATAKAREDADVKAKALADAQAAAAESAKIHAKSDFILDELNQTISDLRQKLMATETEKAAAEREESLAQQKQLMAKEELLSIIGGKGVTQQGCVCKSSFTYEDKQHTGCIDAVSNLKAMGKKWCVVEGTCGSSLGDGQFFDTCPPLTKQGCSCRNSFMTKGHLVVGCTEERSQGQPWCKVRETGCGEQNGDGAWWDFCV